MTTNTPSILIETQSTTSGHTLGIITFVNEKMLNAINTQMCHAIAKQLKLWKNDDDIVAVLLKGSGDRAFCAGGNIRQLYDAMIQYPVQSHLLNAETEEFFVSEYHTHFCMHSFNKPIIAWATGIVMGGGMGLLNASSHRVVTETTKFAMPEMNIGLFPDACGSWFLQRMPAKSGLFFGLTASQGNGSDALFANMADYALASNELDKLLATLLTANWNASKNKHDIVSQALAHIHHSEQLSEGNIIKHWQIIQETSNKGSIHDIDSFLRCEALANKYADDNWMTSAINNYKNGCPTTAAVTFSAFNRANTLSVIQVLQMELTVALHRANQPDFREGVRALLIDKDKSPKWSRTLAECDESFINSHFESPYIDSHPFDSWTVN